MAAFIEASLAAPQYGATGANSNGVAEGDCDDPIPPCAAGLATSGLSIQRSARLLAVSRCRPASRRRRRKPDAPPVSIVQPLRGVESFSRDTLTSIFALDYPDYEILFCVADGDDPIVPLVRGFIAAQPAHSRPPADRRRQGQRQPKLNNCVKGWKAARHDWIVIADSNVLMPPDYIHRLLSRWRDDTGIVCSPPIGSAPEGFAAETRMRVPQHLRGALAICGRARRLRLRAGQDDAVAARGAGARRRHRGAGRRDRRGRRLDQAGPPRRACAPISSTARSPSRSASAAFREVWRRQLRWARLRRATFPHYYTPEIVTSERRSSWSPR